MGFEGIPHPYDRKKRMVIPTCLKVLRLRPERRFCKLGDLLKEVGWKHQDLIGRLETMRKTSSKAYYEKRKAAVTARAEAKSAASISAADKEVLVRAGYT